MKKIKQGLVAFMLVMTCFTLSAPAQIYVHVRPGRPHYVRTVAPSPRHVWVDEEWRGRGRGYEWSGGYWAVPPHPGWGWVPGHWRQRPRGWVWVPGHWRH
jgi:hypothetical protein